MKHNLIRFSCNGCGACCKERLIPLTLEEAEAWLCRGGEVAIILEAFNESAMPDSGQFVHSSKRAVEVRSGDASIHVIAIFAGNALTQCPSLGFDNRCGIYDERPLVCRIYPAEINPFVELDPLNKICPPEVWDSGEIIYRDKLVNPVLKEQVEKSRQTDRDDARKKIAVCEAIGINVAAWKGDALAIYLPDRQTLQQIIQRTELIDIKPAATRWKVRTESGDIQHTLRLAGIELDTATDVDYTLYPL